MATPSSDAGFMMSDGPSRAAATPRRNYGVPSSSASRPRGPPSENMGGAPSDEEGDGFADDQVPRGLRINNTAEISRVEDRIGLLVQEHFESFIEKYLQCYPPRHGNRELTHGLKQQLPRGSHQRSHTECPNTQRSHYRQVLCCPDRGHAHILPLDVLRRLQTFGCI